MNDPIRTFDIEIYDTSVETWAQGRYLVHGHSDSLWTDDLDIALEFLQDSCNEVHQQTEPDVTALVELLAEARDHVVFSTEPVRGGFIDEIDTVIETYRKH